MAIEASKDVAAPLDKKIMNECMQKSREYSQRMRNYYGPSNSELLRHIAELKDQIKILTEKVDKCLNTPQ